MLAPRFTVIYADPPWRYRTWRMGATARPDEAWGHRKGRPPYDCMDTAEICALPVELLCARDCVLFLWATYPMLPDAFEVIRAWGFEYKTCAWTWVKQNPSGEGFHFGLGYWTRQSATRSR